MLSDTMMLGGGRKAAYPIENSLLFRGGQYLSRTPQVAGDRKTWTFSAWVRRNRLGARQTVFASSLDSRGWDLHSVHFGADDKLIFAIAVDTGVAGCATAKVFRDPTAWLHVVAVFDSTNDVPADGMRLYVNGERMLVSQAVESSKTWPIARNTEGFINRKIVHDIGRTTYLPDYYAALQMTDLYFVDGQALSPNTFGETDPVTGSWRPKKVSGIDFGTTGFHLGNPWNAANLGADLSGKGNTWTPSGFAATDVVKDSPTNVYATLNPLDRGTLYNPILSEGNLRAESVYNMQNPARATIAVNHGKWYFEAKCVTHAYAPAIGITNAVPTLGTGDDWRTLAGTCRAGYNTYQGVGLISTLGGAFNNVGAPSFGTGDTIMAAFDADSGKVWFGKNGVWINSGDPAAGSNHTAAVAVPNLLTPYLDSTKASSVADVWQANFGQRAFAYAPPAGFKALCTANLPATTGVTSGSFTGNASADGPCVYTGAVPLTLSINGNAVTWGTHADKLATGFKIRSAATAYNASGTNTWVATYATPQKPTVARKGRAPANAQAN